MGNMMRFNVTKTFFLLIIASMLIAGLCYAGGDNLRVKAAKQSSTVVSLEQDLSSQKDGGAVLPVRTVINIREALISAGIKDGEPLGMRGTSRGAIQLLARNRVKNEYEYRICLFSADGTLRKIRMASDRELTYDWKSGKEGVLGPFAGFPVLPQNNRLEFRARTDGEREEYQELYRDPYGKTWKLQATYASRETNRYGHRLIMTDEKGETKVIFDDDNGSAAFQEIRQLNNGDLLLILNNSVRRIDLKTGEEVLAAPKGKLHLSNLLFDRSGNLWLRNWNWIAVCGKKDARSVAARGVNHWDARAFFGFAASDALAGKINTHTIKVAVVGGTGNIGLPIVNRLKQSGTVEVLVGSRKADQERGILSNEEAVAVADVVIFTVPAVVFKDTVIKMAPLMKKDAIVLSMVVPMGKDQDTGRLIHQPAEGFSSGAEEMAALLSANAPGKNIRVVAGLHNIPGECIGDPLYVLEKHKVVVMGDDAKACGLVCDKVISKIGDLEPVVQGSLADSKYSEALTSLIIRSKKELLQGRSLVELFNFVKERDGKVELQDILAYNREALDPLLRAEYLEGAGSAERLRRDIEKLFTQSVRTKEFFEIRFKRLSQLIPEASMVKPVVDEALTAYSVYATDMKLFSAIAGVDGEFIARLKTAGAQMKSALVISAKTILKNGAVISTLKEFASANSNPELVAWSENADEMETLKEMGVGRVALLEHKPLTQVVVGLNGKGVTNDRIVVVAAEARDTVKEMLADITGIKSVVVAEPKAKDASTVNVMPLALAKAAAIAVQDAGVSEQYARIARSYEGKVSADELKQLEDLTSDISVMPLVTVEAEVAKAQITYEETVSKI